MKKLLLLICLIFATQTAFCLNQQDEKRQRKYERRVKSLLDALILAKSKEDAAGIAGAYYDLQEACNTNECKVTNEQGLLILKTFKLIDDNGFVPNSACETIKDLKEHPHHLDIKSFR